MQDLPDPSDSAQDTPTDTRHPLPQETTPAARLAALAAWERFKSELGEAAHLRDAQEVSAMNAIFNELMRPVIYPDAVFELVVESAATLTGASGSAIALAEGGTFVCRAAYGSTAPPVGTHLNPRSGLSGLCVSTGHMLRCDDAKNDPRVDSLLTRETGIRSINVVPLIKDGKLVGILGLLSTQANAFGKKETETLLCMAKLAVLTLTRMDEFRDKSIEQVPERAELAAPAAWEQFKSELGEAAHPRDAQEVSAMNAIFNELMRPGIYPDAVFELVVESAATLTGADGSAIALAEGGRFVCRAAYGSTAPPVGTRLDPSSGLSGLCVSTGHMLRCDDAENDPRVDSRLTRKTGIRSINVVPLIKDGKLVGILELLSTQANAFGKKETETLLRMAKLAVLTMTRMGELRGKSIERKAQGRWWRVLSLMLLAFCIGFAVSRLLGPLLLGKSAWPGWIHRLVDSWIGLLQH